MPNQWWRNQQPAQGPFRMFNGVCVYIRVVDPAIPDPQNEMQNKNNEYWSLKYNTIENTQRENEQQQITNNTLGKITYEFRSDENIGEQARTHTHEKFIC